MTPAEHIAQQIAADVERQRVALAAHPVLGPRPSFEDLLRAIAAGCKRSKRCVGKALVSLTLRGRSPAVRLEHIVWARSSGFLCKRCTLAVMEETP